MDPNGDDATGGRRSIEIGRPWRVTIAVTIACLLVLCAAAAGTGGSPVGTAAADADSRVDVVFVFDRSESMDDDRYSLSREMEAIDERLRDRDVDVRYALLTYQNSTRVEQDWTDDYADVDGAMNFRTSGSTEAASGAILEATSMSFREDAERVVVLVTDEDDDSDEAKREAAEDALSSVRFVTVSPADPSVSSCEYHSPPCDDDEANELRRVAEDASGDWIDVGSSAESIVEDVGTAVETAATGSSSGGAVRAATGDSGSDLRTTNVTVNRSAAEVGEPVEIAATVENAGGSPGTFDALLADATGLMETRSIEVPSGAVRTVRFNHTYVDPGTYELFVTHEYAGQVEVTPRPDTAVETRALSNGSGIEANVSDPRANTSVTVPLGKLDSPRGEVVTLDALTVTPADDADFRVDVLTRATRPDGTTPLPGNVRAASYLTANASTTLADEDDATTAFEYATAIDEVRLYRYEPNGSGWSALEAEPANGSSGRATLVATSPGLSHFAIGVGEPAFEVTGLSAGSTSVDTGESVEATVTVANEGAANGTYAATLAADGQVVDRTEVFVPAGDSRRVDLAFVPDGAGDVRLSSGEASGTTISVRGSSNAGDAEERTTESSGQPGFGPALLVAALLGWALLAARRR